jgi:cysteine sulfinate desulfinase/cysteine desulfurase-like protein
VKQNGLIDLNQLREAITPETALVTIMAVNNEIGVVQPMAEIGKLCREKYEDFMFAYYFDIQIFTMGQNLAEKLKLDFQKQYIYVRSWTNEKLYSLLFWGKNIEYRKLEKTALQHDLLKFYPAPKFGFN